MDAATETFGAARRLADGPVVVPQALVPVHCDVARDQAVYVEPNIWVHHGV